MNFAFCAGWIDSDLYSDIKIIKKLRDYSAHSIENILFNDEEIRKEIEKLVVPKRKYYDWGAMWAVYANEGEIVISTGKKPENIKKNLYIPGTITLNMALPIIFIVLISSLKIPFCIKENNDIIFTIDLPDYMKDF